MPGNKNLTTLQAADTLTVCNRNRAGCTCTSTYYLELSLVDTLLHFGYFTLQKFKDVIDTFMEYFLSSQIEALRQLCSSKRGDKEVPIENNFRTINPIGKRMIKKPEENPKDY